MLLTLAKHKLWTSQIPMSDEFLAHYIAESYDKNGEPGTINQYGMLLAEVLLNKHPDKYGITLSSLADNARSGRMPLPICTAITSRDEAASGQRWEPHPGEYSWFEFTPFTAGIIESSTLSGAGFIPIWSLGRSYVKQWNGKVFSTKDPRDSFYWEMLPYLSEREYYSIEPSLNQLMAAFGSAFTVTAREASAKAGDSVLARMVVTALMPQIKGFNGLMVNNFYNPKEETITTAQSGSRPPIVKTIKNSFELRDAGIAFNLPVVPLLNPKRGINIVIILDASSDLEKDMGKALKEFRLYAKHYSIKIPAELENEAALNVRLAEIQKMDLEQKELKVSTFGDWSKPDELMVIYVPTVKNSKLPENVRSINPMEYGTFKNQYSHQESDNLIKYNRALGNQVSDYIKQVIEQKTKALNLGAQGKKFSHSDLEMGPV